MSFVVDPERLRELKKRIAEGPTWQESLRATLTTPVPNDAMAIMGRAYQAAWAKAKREADLEAARAKGRAKMAAWRSANPDKARASELRKQAKRAANPESVKNAARNKAHYWAKRGKEEEAP